MTWKRRRNIVQTYSFRRSLVILDCLTARSLSDLASYRPRYRRFDGTPFDLDV